MNRLKRKTVTTKQKIKMTASEKHQFNMQAASELH